MKLLKVVLITAVLCLFMGCFGEKKTDGNNKATNVSKEKTTDNTITGVFTEVDMEGDFVYSGIEVNGKVEWFVGDILEFLKMKQDKVKGKKVKVTIKEEKNPYDKGTIIKSITNVELVN
ncbi:MAG: hypothetical protein LBH98_07305 [Chitinispirillales bacterium]|jgi:hypothetical protein|nr:hypothetical protein [Chitinispirillales bacterium]